MMRVALQSRKISWRFPPASSRRYVMPCLRVVLCRECREYTTPKGGSAPGQTGFWWVKSDNWYRRLGRLRGGFRSLAATGVNGEVAPIPDLRSTTLTDKDAP